MTDGTFSGATIGMGNEELAAMLRDAETESEKYETCMALTVNEAGDSVELCLDTSLSTYSEWIQGEGADICLLRCMETGKVVGCHLPLMDKKLCVHHEGPIRINAGFRKDDSEKAKP